MARTVRNAKTDSRSARAKLSAQPEPYWTKISKGYFIGYRKGAKSGTWIARYRANDGKQRYQALGAADDAMDADGIKVFDFAQAQIAARDWFGMQGRIDAGQEAAQHVARWAARHAAASASGGPHLDRSVPDLFGDDPPGLVLLPNPLRLRPLVSLPDSRLVILDPLASIPGVLAAVDRVQDDRPDSRRGPSLPAWTPPR